jgi:hypothetical protein
MNIEINELATLLGGTQKQGRPPITGPQQIVVLDRGWVFVGNARYVDGGLAVDNARCIRIWGTARGIGQLAETGPTEQTKLDPCGSIIAPDHAVILIIPCKSQW